MENKYVNNFKDGYYVMMKYSREMKINVMIEVDYIIQVMMEVKSIVHQFIVS